MKFLRFFEGNRPERLISWLLLLAFTGLVVRGQGVLPSVMADEWHYSLLARLLPFSQSDDLGFAYLGFYGLTNACADGYLGCVRVLNALFFVGGCFLVFRSARHFLPPAKSLGVAAVALLAPESVYTVFFMPESMYFFLFWAFAFVALSAAHTGNFSGKTVVLSGGLLALASLVKPHAIFLVACFGLYLLIVWSPSNISAFGRRLSLFLVFIVTFLGVKFFLGFLAAGKSGVTVFGSRYSNMASQNVTAERLIDLVTVSGQILLNHLGLVMFMFFVPIFGALKLLISPERGEEGAAQRNLALFLLLVLVPLIGVTAAFSASVAGTNPYDVVDRVHMRYYNFSVPLLIIMSGVLLARDEGLPLKGSVGAAVICLPLFVLGAVHLVGWLSGLQINWVDSPGLMFLGLERWIRVGLLALGLCVVLLSLISLQRAAKLYLLVFLPVLFLIDSYAIQKVVEVRKKPDVYDVAGMAVNALLKGRVAEQATLFGPDESLLYKTSFFLDRTNTAIRVVNSGQPVDPALVPAEATQVIVFGGGYLDKPGFELVLDQGFKLFSLRNK